MKVYKTLAPFAPLLLAVVVTAQTPGPAPRYDAWKVIGPGGGGTTASVTISPSDPSLVVERCDMTGGYITHDAGLSWRMFNLRSGLTTFAFAPGNPRQIYAGGAALWRSDDTGRTWKMIFPNPAEQTIEHQNGDHADYSLTSNDSNYVTGLSITQIVVDPADSNTVHIAFSNPETKGTTLLESKDAGASFQHEQDFDADKILLLTYTGAGRVAIGSKGVYLNQASFPKPIGDPAETIQFASAGASQGTTRFFATASSGKLYISDDGGMTWQDRTPALGQQAGKFDAVAASKDGFVAYAGFRGLKLGDRIEDIYNGIAKTTDAGKNWAIVFRESTKPASNLDASWLENRGISQIINPITPIFFDAPYSLGVAPGNPAIAYATDLFRTYRTMDGGKTWAQLNSVQTADGHWTTRGIDVTTNYGVQFDPFDPKHVFIDYTDIGAFQSHDGGQSWDSATEGIPEAWRNTTYWLAFDPSVKNLMWGAFSGIHDLPRYKMWRSNPALSGYAGGVAVSQDGGKHWTSSNKGMPETAVTHVLLDPASPAGSRTLYACGFGKGVYKSTDNGKSWQLKNTGITELHPFAWRITLDRDGALYLIVARGNGGVFGQTYGSGALYKSVDGAEHWTKINLPENVNGPTGLAIDPRDSSRLYLTAWGQQHAPVDIGGGVYLSTDGGSSWKPIFQKSQHVYDLTIDPKAPDTLYISGFDAAAYRSTDAGRHWARIQGFNFKWGHRVIVDPNDDSKIYITTYGGSVWHGPAAGDPSATEDILTPVPVAQ